MSEMSKKQKKLKKIKKNHIVGPILFLLGYTGVVTAFIITIVSLILIYMIDGYVDKDVVILSKIGMEYDALLEEGNSTAFQAVQRIQNDFDDVMEHVIVKDKKGNTVVAMGPDTCNWETEIEVDLGADYLVYEDTQEPFNFKSNDIQWDFLSSREQFLETAKEVVFWLPVTVQNGNQTIYVKFREKITFKSILEVYFVVAVMSLFEILPILFLLRNIIGSFINQRRMMKLLYFDSATGGKNWMFVKLNGNKYLHKNQKYNYAVIDFEFMKYRSYCTCHGIEEGEELLEKMNSYLDIFCSKKELTVHHSKANFLLLLLGDTKAVIEDKIRLIWKDLENLGGSHHIEFHAGILYMDDAKRAALKAEKKRTSLEELFQCAGAARASVAEKQGNVFAYYSEQMLENQLWEHKVEDEMEGSLQREEFVVYLQPKYDPVKNELIAAEALVRWNHPKEGFIPPGRFIPLFEKTGFIRKLDDYMISHVAKLQARWMAEEKQIVPISVNVSRAHFADPNLAEHIRALVDCYQVPHNYIEIELTESAFFDDKSLIFRTVTKLQEYGFEVSMDDFGSGYSSLNSLKDLPLDILKLDAEFFRGEDSTKRGEIVISEAIRLAKSLNMKIVAEGVEKKEQVDFLAQSGCDMIQGYYFAKPMPVGDFEARAFVQNA